MKKKGKFIVIEGLDGAGKTSCAVELDKIFKNNNIESFLTKEPTESKLGKIIRNFLSDSKEIHKNAYLEASLFFSDRLLHISDPNFGVEKKINDGLVVISDRYYLSTFAYQSLNCDMNWLFDLHFNCPKIIKPDVTFFLDIDPNICFERLKNRPIIEKYEKISLMLEIRKNFLEIIKRLKNENIRILNVNLTPKELAKKIFEEINI